MAYDPIAEGRDQLTARIIDAAIEVHRELGPGLLESTYEECLCIEMGLRDINFVRQTAVPIVYKGNPICAAYRLDLIVESTVIVEVKAVEKLAGVHEAQLLTYLKHTGLRTGLLFNFNSQVLRQGTKRFSL